MRGFRGFSIWVLFFMGMLLLPVLSQAFISSELKKLYVVDQYYMNMPPQGQKASLGHGLSPKRYLVLELSATITQESLMVFANDFLLVGSTGEESKYYLVAQAIGLTLQNLQHSLNRSFADSQGHLNLSRGKASFMVAFCLPFHLKPGRLLYFGAWPLAYRVPYRLLTEVESARYP